MTPMQLLVRLAELTRQITALPTGLESNAAQHRALLALQAERDRIVAAVPSVPAELADCNDASLWAHIFEQRYPTTTPTGIIEVWFDHALRGARLAGIKEGSSLGQVQAREQRTAAQGDAVKVLELVASLLTDRKLVDLRLRGAEPGSEPVHLSAVVADALAAL